MDLAIREFRESIVRFINDTELSIEVKRLVVKEIYQEIKDASDKKVKELILERSSAEKQDTITEEKDNNAESVSKNTLEELPKH